MEQLLLNHARNANRGHFRYEAAYLLPDKDHMVLPLSGQGVVCHCLGSRGDLDPRWWLRLRSLLRTVRPDVIHAHSPMTAVVARVIARTFRRRPAVLYTEHNSWGCYRLLTRTLNAITYLLDDRQLAVSSAAYDSVPRLLRRRLAVLHHGLDIDDVRRRGADRVGARVEMGVGDDEVVIGTVANLRPEKNYEGLLEVAARVTRERPVARFVSIGQGPLLNLMKLRRSELGLTDAQFVFRGYEPDAVRLMAGFDLFVLASHHEGLPVACMEARALRLPVISTAVGGMPEMVQNGVDGLLVPPGDMEALGSELIGLVDDRHRLNLFSEESAASAVRFDGRESVKRIEEIYAELCAVGRS